MVDEIKIPKKIFYVWLGDQKDKLANICIENWRMMLPDYEIIEINEKSPYFDFDYEYNNCLWFRTVYDLKLWAYASDYIRAKVLYENGGIYLDTDITIYKSFNNLLDSKAFLGVCLNKNVELAVFGVEKNNFLMKEMINFYDKKIWQSPDYITSSIITHLLVEKYNIEPSMNNIVKKEDITIYPPEFFYPYHHSQEFNHKCITDNTYTVHWMEGSWHSKKNLFFLSNKHRIPLKTLLKQMEFIEKVDKNANNKTKIGE